MIADGSASEKYVTYATMQTPALQQIPLTCMMQLYYYLHGGTYGEMNFSQGCFFKQL